jgi:hypothetical protein
MNRYDLVWEKTILSYNDMITCEGWTDKDVVEVPVVQNLTFKVCDIYSFLPTRYKINTT